MNEYTSLAKFWDSLTGADSAVWADYLQKRFGAGVKSVFEIACGTGSLAIELAQRGYDVTASDISPEMLAEASAKSVNMDNRPLFLCQDMRDMDLYGTCDAAFCCLDGINYLSGTEDLRKTFGRLKYFINPGGLFIFDINTAVKFRALNGQAFTDECEGLFCVWQTEYNEKSRQCSYFVDLFIEKNEKNGLWERFSEEHTEFAFKVEEITAALLDNGFGRVEIFGELSENPPEKDEERIFFSAVRDNY